IRIGISRRVTEGVAQRLADWTAFRFQLLAGVAVFLPGFRELVQADVLEPRLAIGDLRADDAPGHPDPLLAVVGDRPRHRVEALLRLADLLGQVAHVDDALGIELRPVIDAADDVRAGARLDRRGG